MTNDLRRILVVEDLPSLRDLIAETLHDLGPNLEVRAAGDGREALDLIEASAQPFHLIMSDIIMPRLDGEALLAELRRRNYPAAVIMLTALGQDDIILRCLRLGACDYLIKPVDMAVLELAATNALRHLPSLNQNLAVTYDPHGWFEVTGDSDPAVLYKFRRFLGLMEQFRIPEPAASEVRLALEELGRNAIEWGNRNDRRKQVRFACRILPGKVIVSIEDEGEGFDPASVPDPSLDPMGHLERRKQAGKRVGGYGIHLIKHLMDKLIYSARGNRVIAIKYFDRLDGTGG
jgi:CheY-like chemotaxis protein